MVKRIDDLDSRERAALENETQAAEWTHMLQEPDLYLERLTKTEPDSSSAPVVNTGKLGRAILTLPPAEQDRLVGDYPRAETLIEEAQANLDRSLDITASGDEPTFFERILEGVKTVIPTIVVPPTTNRMNQIIQNENELTKLSNQNDLEINLQGILANFRETVTNTVQSGLNTLSEAQKSMIPNTTKTDQQKEPILAGLPIPTGKTLLIGLGVAVAGFVIWKVTRK